MALRAWCDGGRNLHVETEEPFFFNRLCGFVRSKEYRICRLWRAGIARQEGLCPAVAVIFVPNG